MDLTQASPVRTNRAAATAASTRKRRVSELTPFSINYRASKRIAYEPASFLKENGEKVAKTASSTASDWGKYVICSGNVTSNTEVEREAAPSEPSPNMSMAVLKPPINCTSSPPSFRSRLTPTYVTYFRFLDVFLMLTIKELY